MTRDAFMSYERIFLDDKDFMFSLQLQVREYTFDFDKVIAAVRSFFAYKVALPKEYGAYTDENDVRKNLMFFLPSHFKREAEKPKPAPTLPAYKANNVEEKRVPTEAEKKKAREDWQATMVTIFKRFKLNGSIYIPFPTFQHNSFVELGFIKKNDHLLYLEDAKRHLIERSKSKRLTTESTQRNGLTALIARLEGNQATENDMKKILQHAHLMAIREFFNSITELKF